MAFFLRVTGVVLAVIGLTSASGCPPLWTRYHNNCYRFVGPEMSWTDAENQCRKFFTISGQGHLASVHSSDENDFLIQYLESSIASTSVKQVWMGLFDQLNDETFSWSDGTAMDYNDGWLNGEPNNSNEDCGEILFHVSHGTGWNDHVCSNLHSYVCKMPVVKGCF